MFTSSECASEAQLGSTLSELPEGGQGSHSGTRFPHLKHEIMPSIHPTVLL